MIPALRKQYNQEFTEAKYQAFLDDLDKLHPGAVQFRLAETPVFVPRSFTNKMLDTCENIIDLILDAKFISSTQQSIPSSDKVAGSYGHPQTIAFDFGVCVDEEQQLVPMLIEMQGFPSLYGFQAVYPEIMRRHLPVPDNFSQYLGGFTHDTYVQFFRKVLLGNHAPEEVILLEIKPHEQKTRVDFYCTEAMTGIKPVCITELRRDGKNFYYIKDGKSQPVKRIYNRLIFDELYSRNDLENIVNIREEANVEWVPHPDWFYRVSKYTLPLISHLYIPETYFLHEIKQVPRDLHNYVLKPLFSFAGQGVVIDVRQEDLDAVSDPHNWILQHKVHYADVIETPEGPAKTEIRIMYLWEDGAKRPKPVINLARLSKGKMIGTRYNKDKKWVGGSVAFFEH